MLEKVIVKYAMKYQGRPKFGMFYSLILVCYWYLDILLVYYWHLNVVVFQ